MSEQTDFQTAETGAPSDQKSEEETLEQVLERRRKLPKDERGEVRPPSSIREDPKKLFKWSVVCLYQDNPLLVIAASAILAFELIKTMVDVLSSFF